MSLTSQPSPDPLPANDEAKFVLIPERLAVQVKGTEIIVTRTQFTIFALLVKEPGRVFRRSELVESGFGPKVTERTVDVHIKELRRKLGPYRSRIETVRGIGYRFVEKPPPVMDLT